MRIFLFFLLLSVAAWAGAPRTCHLQSAYWVEGPVVNARTIDPGCGADFALLKLPDDTTSYRVDANVLSKTFELNGFTLEKGSVRYVTFSKRSPVDFTAFKEQLETLLHERYETIQIDRIDITPRGYLASLPREAKAVFDDRTPLNSKGTFYTLDAQGMRRYLDYSVEATLTLLHTSRAVSRKEAMSGINTRPQTIRFSSFRDTPLSRLPENGYRYRSSLKSGQLLTLRNIEPTPQVLKNAKVVAVIRDGAVLVEFIATATQEGSLYDIITIQKSDGTRVKGKVIGENRVELQ